MYTFFDKAVRLHKEFSRDLLNPPVAKPLDDMTNFDLVANLLHAYDEMEKSRFYPLTWKHPLSRFYDLNDAIGELALRWGIVKSGLKPGGHEWYHHCDELTDIQIIIERIAESIDKYQCFGVGTFTNVFKVFQALQGEYHKRALDSHLPLKVRFRLDDESSIEFDTILWQDKRQKASCSVVNVHRVYNGSYTKHFEMYTSGFFFTGRSTNTVCRIQQLLSYFI